MPASVSEHAPEAWPQAYTEEGLMPSQNDNDGRDGPWSSGAKSGPNLENLIRKGQARLRQNMPSGEPRRIIVIVILALFALGAWTAYYTVPSDSVAVVQRFGKYLK